MIDQKKLEKFFSTGSRYFYFDGNYENNYFTPFSGRNENETVDLGLFWGTRAVTKLSALEDLSRNIVAIVIRPIINIGRTMGYVFLAAYQFLTAIVHMLASLATSGQKNRSDARQKFEAAGYLAGMAVLHAINTPFSSIDAVVRLMTHSCASSYQFLKGDTAEQSNQDLSSVSPCP